jgi:hypothetical protein
MCKHTNEDIQTHTVTFHREYKYPCELIHYAPWYAHQELYHDPCTKKVLTDELVK